MSIRAVFLLVFTTLVLLLALLVTASYRASGFQRRVADAQQRRYESWTLADQLRQSSDELTRMARTFVVTGDPRYYEYFEDVLAIRAGEQPRPPGYDGIYWDFVVAGARPEATGGTAIALEDLMRRLEFSEAEFDRLRVAGERSNALARLEEMAINAAQGRFADENDEFTLEAEPDLELARAIMHGERYHRTKAEIMEPIATFMDMLDTRTTTEVASAQRLADRAQRLVFGLALAAAAVAIVSFFVLLRLMIAPIRRLVGRLEDIAEGEGDLTRRVDEHGRSELGRLGHWFNRFVRMVHDIVREVMTTSSSIASAASEIAATSAEQRTTADDLDQSARQIAVAVNEISATGGELASTMNGVSDIARRAAALATSGQGGLRELEATTQTLRASTESFAGGLAALEEKAAGVNRIVATIVKVADQTNLLSVNAAIEADQAGDHETGFRVVAREIRHLAEQTAVATLEIERDVQAMQSAMSDGMKQMEHFNRDVGDTGRTVARVGGQLGEIIDQVRGLTTRFESVNEGVVHQAAGIRQISAAMTSLTKNATRTSESAADFARTAEQLHETTATLQRQVSRFRLEAAG